jgi:hypothetical protein
MENTMSVADGLVQLIENNSDRLAETMLMRLQACDRCDSFRHVPREEFRQRVYEIYDHLGEWLMDKKESEVARRYIQIGITREKQGVLLSELMYAIIMTREHLWDFLKQEAKIEKPKEIFGELEVMELLEQFFDRAMYYAAQGYEQSAGKFKREATHGVGR